MLRNILSLVLKPLIVLSFWPYRWFRHNLILFRGGYSPAFLSLPLIIGYQKCFSFKNFWQTLFTDYSLSKYVKLIAEHYSSDGFGYQNLSSLTESQCLERYKKMPGRLEHYLNNNTLSYGAKDKYLDAGCGEGANIRILRKHFPESTINGFDLNEHALRIIRVANPNDPRLSLSIGSLADPAYLAAYATQSVDHVIVSHVLTLIIAESLEDTHQLRQKIIDELIRISAKSILIMDVLGDTPRNLPHLFIEYKTRCSLRETFVGYFDRHLKSGQLTMMFGPDNEALFFKRTT